MLSYFRTRRWQRARVLPVSAVRPARDVIAAEREGLAVLLDLRRDVYFTLEEVGTLVWHEIELGHDVAAATDRVCDEYDAPRDVARQDVERFMAELVTRGLAVPA